MLPVAAGLIAAGAMGYLSNQQAQQAQKDAAARAQALIDAVPLPVLQKYYPELYKQVVELAPEAETAVKLGPTAFEGIQSDAQSLQAQRNALLKLQQISDEGGLTATDKAKLAEIENQQAAALRGQTGAIQQNLAARGLSGGMSELVARNIAAQEAANRSSQQGLDVAANAEQRALQAIINAGQLGGNINQQQFNQASQIAQAKDVINKFNAANLQDVGSRNIAARNAAQQWNAAQKQGIAGQNVGLQNQAQQYNLNLPQQQYQNAMAKATGQASGINSQAQLAAQQQAQNMQFLGGLMQTGANYYGGLQNQKDKKEGQA